MCGMLSLSCFWCSLLWGGFNRSGGGDWMLTALPSGVGVCGTVGAEAGDGALITNLSDVRAPGVLHAGVPDFEWDPTGWLVLLLCVAVGGYLLWKHWPTSIEVEADFTMVWARLSACKQPDVFELLKTSQACLARVQTVTWEEQLALLESFEPILMSVGLW